MIAVCKLIHGQKVYLYDEAGNVQLFPNVIAARVSLAMTGITEDRITGEGFIFEHWDESDVIKQELTENEKKLQEQIDKLLDEIVDLKKELDYYKNAYYAEFKRKDQELTLNSEVAMANIKKKLKGE